MLETEQWCALSARLLSMRLLESHVRPHLCVCTHHSGGDGDVSVPKGPPEPLPVSARSPLGGSETEAVGAMSLPEGRKGKQDLGGSAGGRRPLLPCTYPGPGQATAGWPP